MTIQAQEGTRAEVLTVDQVRELEGLAPEQRVAPASLPLSRHMPDTFEGKMKLAQALASSGLCPEGYKGDATKVFVALELGAELGLAPMMAVNNIAVVNGKPSAMFQVKLGIAQATGLLEDHFAEYTSDGTSCTYTVKRKGKPRAVAKTFSMEDAVRADLAKKDIWKKYPRDMLKNRAGSRAIDEAFPEIFAGLPTPDEAEDYAASAPAPRVTQPWKLSTKDFAALQNIGATRKIPDAERATIVLNATGGRKVEKVDGVPQWTREEYSEILETTRTWSATPSAPAAPAPEQAAPTPRHEPEASAEPPPRKSSLTPETLKALESRIATLHGPGANVAAVVDAALGNVDVNSMDDVSEKFALEAIAVLEAQILTKRKAEKK